MYQLIYKSAASEPCSPTALTALLTTARLRNHLYDISGILLYHAGSFLQVLEGPQSGLEMIYRSIERDPRHVNTTLLFKQPVLRREFSGWSMGFIDPANSRLGPRPAGLIDYERSMSQFTAGDTRAYQLLRFFHQGLCRQNPA